MNVALTYQSGQQYSEYFSNIDIKVSRGTKGMKRVRVSFREKTDGKQGHVSFSLPPKKAKQLAHAILMACVDDDVKPIEFSMEEAPTNQAVAA